MEKKLTEKFGRVGYIGIIFIASALLGVGYFSQPIFYSFLGTGVVLLLAGLKDFVKKPTDTNSDN
ncbi:hypothetical protein [Enterococcus sp. HY326]|uniref:hypothetical protein n=1 Tax=Enterococcus sp. HY326 TaxID=2971265 RepID=UPI00223EAB70|nr:hypothetical protein [Enterococcus sp. HY326]